MQLFEVQRKIKKFTEDKQINSPVEIRILDLASEVGELSKEVLKSTNYGEKEFKKTKGWDNEIGDVLFSIICIANETDTNLEDSLNLVLEKYEKRFASKGNIGSCR
ncbi:MazG nucleotide pyrophosphohydrolase domain-containing protein [Fervidibacillus halotolerans]|uniref:Nucleotide pyrophosphohydrolase n=1 Tax=Fervidibacillus halotolerans TaxID=2980027 RepID=A0A9E8RXZ3_9BACI|nr:MazG nucleotide pyrophosphohydrolase domain-containing protein [Fervidibacillus halotolerans]WAA12316.1 nucleotide pyrophosphohydrolase [Fervidibacillus halotolerans]